MKIALVYDRVNKWGGAERVLLALHEIWPKAPLYTAVYDPKGAPWAKNFSVIPSFLQKIPFAKSRHEMLAPLIPIGFESFNFDQYDVVISVTSEAAKGIITKPKTLHICYCLTPTRYLWSGYKDYFSLAASLPAQAGRLVSKPAISYLRKWDQIAGQRPDYYLAISKNVRKRIKKYYQRDSEVVYPPVDTKKFKVQSLRPELRPRVSKFKKNTTYHIPHTTYFLVVSRLVPYKRVDIVVEVFNRLGWPLKIVGAGSGKRKLERLAGKNIEFLGQLTDKELISYYQGCQAVVFPQEEDFGLVPLEAQACGKPVIAYRGGGALETVVEARSASPSATGSGPSGSWQGPTGEFFWPQTAKALGSKVQRFKGSKYKAVDCRRQAEKFSKEKFKKNFKELVERLVKQR